MNHSKHSIDGVSKETKMQKAKLVLPKMIRSAAITKNHHHGKPDVATTGQATVGESVDF